jgi:hypothetical protein
MQSSSHCCHIGNVGLWSSLKISLYSSQMTVPRDTQGLQVLHLPGRNKPLSGHLHLSHEKGGCIRTVSQSNRIAPVAGIRETNEKRKEVGILSLSPLHLPQRRDNLSTLPTRPLPVAFFAVPVCESIIFGALAGRSAAKASTHYYTSP